MNDKLHFHEDMTHTKCPNWDVCTKTGNKELKVNLLEDYNKIREELEGILIPYNVILKIEALKEKLEAI